MHRQPGLGFGLVRGQVRAKVRWIERGQGEGGDRVRIRVWGWLELDFRLGFGLVRGEVRVTVRLIAVIRVKIGIGPGLGFGDRV